MKKDVLMKMSHDELLDIIMDYAKQDQSFAKAFEKLAVAKLKNGGKEDAREEVDNSFCKIRPTNRRYYSYDDTDWYGTMKESNELFAKAEKALSMGNLHRAVAYPLQWLQCFSDVFTEAAFSYDHEGIEFEWACKEAMRIIERIITHSEADADFRKEVSKELTDIAEAATVFDDYCFANLKAFAKRMQAMSQSPEEALAMIEELIEKNEYGVSLTDLVIQKSNILFSMNKESEALLFLENNVCEKVVCEHLVNLLINKKDYERALKVLEKAIRIGEKYDSRKWLRKEAEIYEMLKRTDDVINSYRRLFIISEGEFKCYEALKKCIPPSEWKAYLSALMDETSFHSFCFGNTNEKADILVAENDFQGLFDYLCAVDDYYKLELYEHYAPKLPADSQKALLPYYMNALREEAKTAKKRDHYSIVRWHISHMKELNGSEQCVAALLTEFRELYRRRPAFIDELKRV